MQEPPCLMNFFFFAEKERAPFPEITFNQCVCSFWIHPCMIASLYEGLPVHQFIHRFECRFICLLVRLSVHRTLGQMTMKLTRRVLGHSPLRSLLCLHRPHIRLLHTACFARFGSGLGGNQRGQSPAEYRGNMCVPYMYFSIL